MKYVPEREEVEAIKAFTGDVELLGPAEKYFIAVLPIPDLEEKLNAMTFKLEVKYSFYLFIIICWYIFF